jgi:hypothetical protein
MALKKHVDVNHVVIIKKIKEEVNGSIKGTLKKQLANKRLNVLGDAIFKFFIFKDPFEKDDEQQKIFFCKTLAF